MSTPTPLPTSSHGAIIETDLGKQLMNALAQNAPAVISMSAGLTSKERLPPHHPAVACKRLKQADILLVAAAGNDW